MKIVKAITVWQPWANFLAAKTKNYETRSWATTYRGAIAIHAAKRPALEAIDNLPDDILHVIYSLLSQDKMKALPLGAIVGGGNLVACHEITPAFIDKLSERELSLGDFREGRFAWEFEDMRMPDKPIPAKGAQGLWKWRYE